MSSEMPSAANAENVTPRECRGGLFHATFWSSLASAANVTTQVVRAKIAAVFLGPHGVAIITQLNSFLQVNQVVGGLGHASGVMRETSLAHASADQSRMRELHQTFLFTLLVTSSVACLLALLFAGPLSTLLFASTDYAAHLRVTALAIPFSVGVRFLQSILKGLRSVRRLAAIAAIGNLISVLCFVALVLLWDVWGAAISIVVTQSVLFTIAAMFARREGVAMRLARPRSFLVVRATMAYSLAGFAQGVLGGMAGMIVVGTVIAVYGEESGGVYSATWRLSAVYLSVIFAAATSYYYPTLSRAGTHVEVAKEISSTIRLFQLVLTPVILLLIVGHEPIVRLLLSDRFQESGRLLAYHLPGDIGRLCFDLMVLALLARGKVRDFIVWNCVWFCCYIVAVAIAARFSDQLDSISIAYSVTYLVLAAVAGLMIPAAEDWRLEADVLRVCGLALTHVLAASTLVFSEASPAILYGGGALLLVSWAAVFSSDSVGREIIVSVTERWFPSPEDD